MLTQDKTWMWMAKDYSDGELILQKLCARFKSEEDYQAFAEEFKNACTEGEKEEE